MNIYLLRHGETEENKKRVYYGKSDAKLNETGILQIEKAATFFSDIPLEQIYSSTAKRTKETVALILKDKNKKSIFKNKSLSGEYRDIKIPLFEDSRINELNFGVFEGKTYEEIKRVYPDDCIVWDSDWKGFCPKGGESFLQFYNRIKSFIEEIKELPHKNILIATHGGVIKAILCYILGENLDLFWKFSSANADIVLIKYEYENFYIDFIRHVDLSS